MYLFVLAIFVGFAVAEIMVRAKLPPEIPRKIAHSWSCCVIAGFEVFGLSLADLVPIAAAFCVLLFVVRRFKLMRSLVSVDRKTYGEVYLPVAVLILASLNIDAVAFSIAFLILGISDTAASLIGQMFRSPPYQLFGSHKTWAGTAAFLVCTYFVLHMTLFGVMGMPQVIFLIKIVCMSLLIALSESAGRHGSDNLLIPLTSALVIRVFI